MKKKKLAAEAVEETVSEKPAKKQNNGHGSIRDLHSVFFVIGIVLGAVSILFTLISKNGINDKGYFSIQLFGAKKATAIPFLTSALTAWIAAGLSVLSIGSGVTRNILKKQNSLIGYLIGVVALVLSVFALLAVKYP